MWVEPSSLDLPTASVGYKFNLTVWLNLTTLDTATAIQAWQFNLTYNTQYLDVSRCNVTYNNVTSELFQGLTTMPTFSVNEEKGYALIGELTVAGNKPLPCNGSLAWIEFEITETPPQQITIQFNFDPERTYVADTDYNCYYPPADFTAYPASAVFKQIFYLNITVATTGGTTNPAPGTYPYLNGTVATVTAVNDTGYSFDCWLLNGTKSTANPITITMTANYTLEAYFVDDVPPEIGEPIQDPPANNVQPNQRVDVNVTVVDYGTGVKNVTLWYSTDNGTSWETPINMTRIAGTDTYNATIRGYPNCTWITYKIVAYDNNENMAEKGIIGNYKYHVIPEYPSILFLALFMAATFIATIPWKIKRKLQPPIFYASSLLNFMVKRFSIHF
jgi:hypothetical protein